MGILTVTRSHLTPSHLQLERQVEPSPLLAWGPVKDVEWLERLQHKSETSPRARALSEMSPSWQVKRLGLSPVIKSSTAVPHRGGRRIYGNRDMLIVCSREQELVEVMDVTV